MSLINFIYTNLSFFLFITFLIIYLIFKRKKLEVQGSFPFLYILLYKTKFGIEYMKKFNKKFPKFTEFFIHFSRFIGIFGTIFVFIFMFWQLQYIIENNIEKGGGFVLPIKTSSSLVFYVPFLYWIISIFILALVHELAHGIISEKYKVKIKSSGFAFLGIIAPILPAAFVEPDPKHLEKLPFKKKLAILGAGPASNIFFGLIFLIIFTGFSNINNQLTYIDSITFNYIMNDSSLNNYNLSKNITYEIIFINNVKNKEKILSFLKNNITLNKTYNLTLKFNINNKYTIKSFVVKPFNSSGKALIGISNIKTDIKYKKNFMFLSNIFPSFLTLLFYLWLLNISIGLINLLPLWITDGGQITFSYLTKKIGKEKGIKVFNFISFISLILLLLSLFPNLLIKLLTYLKL